MKKIVLILGFAVATVGCSRGQAVEAPPTPATDAAKPAAVTGTGGPTTAGTTPPAPAPSPAPASADPSADATPVYREVTLPAGTALPLTLRTSVGSDTSNVEDQVRATLRRPVSAEGVAALPEGTVVIGHVTDAERSAKVKGRARIAFRFTRVDLPGDGGGLAVRTGTVARVAAGTKKRDAAKIGGGAVGGAIIGGILGGGDGAAKGAAVGGAAGTGVVLATRGKEVTVAAGTPISVKLTAPLTVRVRIK